MTRPDARWWIAATILAAAVLAAYLLAGRGERPTRGVAESVTFWCEGCRATENEAGEIEGDVLVHRFRSPATLQQVSCSVSGTEGLVAINLYDRKEERPNDHGVKMLASPLWCGTGSTNYATAFADSRIEADDAVALVIEAGSVPSHEALRVFLEYDTHVVYGEFKWPGEETWP